MHQRLSRYNEEHLDTFSKIPGWLRTSRYLLDDSLVTGKGKEPQANKHKARHLVIYEFSEQGSDPTSSQEFEDAVSTPYAKTILSKTTVVGRHLEVVSQLEEYCSPRLRASNLLTLLAIGLVSACSLPVHCNAQDGSILLFSFALCVPYCHPTCSRHRTC